MAPGDGVEVYDGTAGCPGAGDVALDCAAGTFNCDVSFVASMGNTYYIRVLGRNNGFGPGSVDLIPDCAALTGLTADYDCATGSVTLNWDGGAHINYDVSSVSQGFIANITANTFTVTNAALGYEGFDVVGYCPNGQFLGATVSVFIADVANPGTDLLLALEGVRDSGNVGDQDSATVLEDALTLNGRSVTRLAVEDFDQFPCLSTLTSAAENIWVVLGTFPFDYMLSTAEGDALAALGVAGKGIYLEGGQHWAGFHNPSLLDDRDGVEAVGSFGNITGGDDSLTQLDGQDSTLAGGDFSGYVAMPYAQDSPGNDLIDQLSVTGTDVTLPLDPNISAGVIWRNSNDAFPTPEDPYIVGIHAVHDLDGGVMISASFEFGGAGVARDLLAGQYLTMFGVVPTLEEFTKGDTNGDGTVNIADAVYLLGNLFPIGAPNVLDCLQSADANNDGSINIADAVAILSALFGSPAQPLAAPYPNCGTELQSPNQTGIGCIIGTCP